MKDILGKMTEEEARKAAEEWQKQQDEFPGPFLSVTGRLQHKQVFCPPTFAAMSAKALEDKEK